MIEIYESDKIQFMAPLSQQEDFFVQEAKDNIPDEYASEGNTSSNDESLLDWTKDDVSRSSVGSSVSSFSRSHVSSHYDTENFSDEEDSDADDKAGTDADASLQDDEVTSSIDVRPSKACTNLLEEAENQEKMSAVVDEDAILMKDDLKDGSGLQADDSGVCSGRTSASPNESDNMADVRNVSELDGNDSSSSFEEINMDQLPEAKDMGNEEVNK